MKRILLASILFIIHPVLFSQGFNYKYGSHRGYNSPYTPQQPSSWSGSGIAIDTRQIAINHHVVDRATNLAIYFPESDKRYKADVIVADREYDLAIIYMKRNLLYPNNFVEYVLCPTITIDDKLNAFYQINELCECIR